MRQERWVLLLDFANNEYFLRLDQVPDLELRLHRRDTLAEKILKLGTDIRELALQLV